MTQWWTGTNPPVLRRMRAGFAVIGDGQHLPGYCVLPPTSRAVTLGSRRTRRLAGGPAP